MFGVYTYIHIYIYTCVSEPEKIQRTIISRTSEAKATPAASMALFSAMNMANGESPALKSSHVLPAMKGCLH